MEYVNIAAYKFAAIGQERLLQLRQIFRENARAWGMRGTILLGPEGINLCVAGDEGAVSRLQDLIAAQPELVGLNYKVSYSSKLPFRRLLVKVKQEIIAFRQAAISPLEHSAPYLEPEELKRWYDEGKKMLVLDTRNDYEYRLGTFKNAEVLDIQQFVQFPEAVAQLAEKYKDMPVITFCTGGIRCEKAAAFMEGAGFKEVYQLRDGILNYFEKCGGAHYEGDCFVFDNRVALNSELKETSTVQCFDCRNPITSEQALAWGNNCQYCQQLERRVADLNFMHQAEI